MEFPCSTSFPYADQGTLHRPIERDIEMGPSSFRLDHLPGARPTRIGQRRGIELLALR